MVRRPTDESEEFWLSITKSQLVEKDIEGHITEVLDLSALLEVQKTKQVGQILQLVSIFIWRVFFGWFETLLSQRVDGVI